MTYKELIVDTKKILYCSHIRLCRIEPYLCIAKEGQVSYINLKMAAPIQSYNLMIAPWLSTIQMTSLVEQISSRFNNTVQE